MPKVKCFRFTDEMLENLNNILQHLKSQSGLKRVTETYVIAYCLEQVNKSLGNNEVSNEPSYVVFETNNEEQQHYSDTDDVQVIN